jgi:hypothetical protein
MGRTTHYERDRETFKSAGYRVRGYNGIAFRVLGWTTAPDADTEWTGIEERTGDVSVVMIGDDRVHVVDPMDVWAIERKAFCGVCGQIGCAHDGLDRDDDDDDQDGGE